ncbi:MAG: ComEC/Rec2 family competence protein [Ectobacillus sp.]
MKHMRTVFFCLVLFFCVMLSGVSHVRYELSIQTSKFYSYGEKRIYPPFSRKMKIAFLKVGQGDAALVTLPNGRNMLIDGGPPEAGELIVHKLVQRGIKSLDLIVSTHPDIDHIGGLITVIQQLPVSMVLDSGKQYYSLTYRMYVKTIRKRNIPFIPAKEGQFLPLDPNVLIQVLNNGKAKQRNNESSIVLKIRYKKADFLLMGDADTKTEKEILDKYPHLHADVLKIGHHGSYTSSSKAFLQRTGPPFVVISYEKGNPYGHPHRSVMKRLHRYGMQIYTTALRDVVFQTDGNSIEIQNGLPLPLLR